MEKSDGTKKGEGLARRQETYLAKPDHIVQLDRIRDEVVGIELTTAKMDFTGHLYTLEKPKKGEQGTYGIKTSGYAAANEIIGINFDPLNIILNQRNRLIVSVTGYWTSVTGQLRSDTEVVELDYLMLWEGMRSKWKEDKWDDSQRKYVNVRQPEVKIAGYRDDGTPIIQLILPADAEARIYEKVLWLRENGIKKAESVCKNRIIKRALGLPASFKHTEGQKFTATVIGARSLRETKDVKGLIDEMYEPVQRNIKSSGLQAEEVSELDANGDDHEMDEPIDAQEGASSSAQPPKSATTSEAKTATPPAASQPSSTQSSSAPGAQAPEGFCDDCGQEIVQTGDFKPSSIIAYSRKQFAGSKLCMECQKKRKKAQSQQ